MGTLLRRIGELAAIFELSSDWKGQVLPAALGVRVHLPPFLCLEMPLPVFMLKHTGLIKWLAYLRVT